jgi:hypothetical protein
MNQPSDEETSVSSADRLDDAELLRRRKALRKMAKFAIAAGLTTAVLTTRRAMADSLPTIYL